ncbi:peptidyl-prolyl cis-trans isomerase [Winogradskyella sp. 3972H.M.0a.05]|uniref:peptidyl-prolyl cis-trans isomerase n=1 Tax=Winogradskyella sp. 3972H.M.0a.05 TaxID=2950277 RepID=UPI0033968805
MFRTYFIGLIVLIGLSSCDFFKPKDDRIPVARVNDNYLYKEDIEAIIPEGSSKTDSTFLANNYINRWALQLLLMEGAERNLTEAKQSEYDALVDQYKSDLFTKAYIEGLVKKNIDTVVSNSEANEVYENNKESFKLNEELVKLRYISLPINAINSEEIEERFKRFDADDKTYLDSIAVQFKSYSLNDSIWVKMSQVLSRIPAVKSEDKPKLLKKSNFVQFKDSLDLYLVHINEVLKQNDYAPLVYVKPTVDQIVINKRKLELITQLENDITKDAIKNNQFEVYKE